MKVSRQIWVVQPSGEEVPSMEAHSSLGQTSLATVSTASFASAKHKLHRYVCPASMAVVHARVGQPCLPEKRARLILSRGLACLHTSMTCAPPKQLGHRQPAIRAVMVRP